MNTTIDTEMKLITPYFDCSEEGVVTAVPLSCENLDSIPDEILDLSTSVLHELYEIHVDCSHVAKEESEDDIQACLKKTRSKLQEKSINMSVSGI
ncbi:hypothetical protein HOF56_01525 [Candidatus Peribacteria bacterium]|jgi:hypothetical protein|nr:hypothetical protein [Candidatus Peribacteria bacterium]MBT4020771.1 hypothetical protein [Candidatus Peribacteria bacterium]MBT4241051.1 hypothetical protein [Candidatus Peribacteria bacterium]MBT4474450.1 hypothetical protein [Candidatus Peribacteria bacterium]